MIKNPGLKLQKDGRKIISNTENTKVFCGLIGFIILAIILAILFLLWKGIITIEDIDLKSRIIRGCLPIGYSILFTLSNILSSTYKEKANRQNEKSK